MEFQSTQPSNEEDWLYRLSPNSSDREAAIEELRRFLVRGLTRALSHRYGSSLSIDDVTQVALLKILKSLDSFRGQSRFTTWAMSIGVRVGISELRRSYYRDIQLASSDDDELLKFDLADVKSDSAEDALHRQALLTLLQQLIDEKLSVRQRVAIRGALDGLPIEEIASRLGSNRNAIYKLVHDARVKLRMGFEENGITVDDVAALVS